jgi:hypothetical protein
MPVSSQRLRSIAYENRSRESRQRRSLAFRVARGARRGLVAVGLGAAMTVSTAIATAILAPAASAAGGCPTKLALVKGNPFEISCGPASAKVHYKGKTYSFKSGTCFRSSRPGGHPLSRQKRRRNGQRRLGRLVDRLPG